ncbi:right-handed parallel beta-helix repeat-containing protein [Planctomyces sp. SH-PL14]|uniref:right-handed parallel beta-helix repeat-containing protein n=1 Tax=Planctomyces sp. SH-PL14 TaxID=1632864 RepID=UPI00078D7D85|nr:right-handed parallel beta-helix repeat-containing protein [Planctomyces sp. SH-PL14]AMV17277.1 hypothetical protein VT03_05255 [Planctomyces sp. SH-PL14]
MFRSASLEALVRRLTRRHSHSGSFCRSSRFPRITAALLGTCVSGWMVSAGAAPALAKEDPEWTQWEEESPNGKPASGSATSTSTSTPTRAPRVEPAVDSSQYMGAIGRGGHLAAPTFGREESISPIEFMPFLMLEEHMFFGDARGFLSNRGQGGGNLGLGYRYLDNPAHAWYGASFWYDIDNSTGYHFQDVGISLEAMVERWEFRGNFYAPVGPETKDLGSFNSNARFAGTQLLFDSTRYTGTAMRGFDIEAGYSLPVDLRGVNDQLRGFLGYYYFTGKNVDDINGVKARVELELSSTVTTNLQFTHDNTFGTNLMVGAQLNLPFGKSNPASQWREDAPNPFRYVERNYNVIVDRTVDFESGVVARDANGNAFVVGQIDSTVGAGGTGAVNDPFGSVAEAQANLTGVNLLFVRSGSVLNEQITLANGQQLIGEGAGASIAVQGYGTLALPTLGPGGGGAGTPIIQGVAGPAVTLGSGSRIAGFTINNITGDAIVGSGINGASVQNVSFNNISGNGIALTNATGNIDLSGLSFDTIGGNGLLISGGSANITASATFQDVTGDGIVVQNTTGGSVTLTDVNVTNAGGRGLFLSNLLGNFFSNNLGIDGTGGNGIEIVGGTGTMEFNGDTTVADPTGSGFVLNASDANVSVNNLTVTSSSASDAVEIDQATGEVFFNRLTVNTSNAASRGLVITDSDDVEIDNGSITANGSAAVDIDNSTIDIRLQSVFANGGAVGIRVLDSDGVFFVIGNASAGSGGTIQNVTNAVIAQNSGTIALQRMTFTNNTNGIVTSGNELVSLSGLTVSGTTNYAYDSLNDELVSIANSTFTNNGTDGTIRIRADVDGTYQYQLLSNTITDTSGTAVSISNSGAAVGADVTLIAQMNTISINQNDESAFEVLWNGPLGINYAGNTVTMLGNNQIGLNLHALSTTDQLSGTISNNALTMSGNNGIGYRIEAEDTSSMLISQNGVTMNGGFGTGFWFDFADATDSFIHTNGVIDNGGSGTGIRFNAVAANSRLQIDNNYLNFASSSPAVDQGIVFSNVSSTIQLFSTTSNTITGATNAIILPGVGQATGSIIINGAAVAAP